MTAAAHARAVRHLRRVDPTMAAVIDRVGRCRFQAYHDVPHFHALISSVIYQQISGKAAETIERRFQGLFDGVFPTPSQLLSTDDPALRSAGLSRQKIGYLRDLAAKAADGSVPFDTLESLPDEGVIESLISIRGIGRWTAQMFLMFRLGRLDVLADGDLGVQNAIRRAYRLRKRPTPERVRKIGARWAPYRTIACWYLWRSLGGPAGGKAG